MPRESVIFGIAGVFFGVLVGWIVGSQYAASARPPAPAAEAPTAQDRTPPLDESRAAALRESAERNPKDAAARIQLANLYFDHDRYVEAARWYQDALQLEPDNVNVSTDLGITYYYMNQPDKALGQFEKSLSLDPAHTKTLLNIGVVRAFGKQDLDGAAQAWQRVIDVAPSSPEAATARQALAGLRSAHPPAGTPRPPSSDERE